MDEPDRSRVLIVGGDRRVRNALKELLEAAAGFTVATVTHDPVAAAASAGIVDVALVELLLPDSETGLALVRKLSEVCGVPVVALSAHDGLRSAALAVGAKDFLTEGSAPEVILDAVRAATSGPLVDGQAS